MRWESLFDDLAGRFDALNQQERDNDIREIVRYESSQIALHERLLGALGTRVRLWLDAQASITGVIRHVGSEWVSTESQVASHLIPLGAINLVEGLPARARTETSAVQLRLGLPSAMREVAALYQPVHVRLVSGKEFTGMIARVGRDYVELVSSMSGESEPGKPGLAIPFASLACVTSS